MTFIHVHALVVMLVQDDEICYMIADLIKREILSIKIKIMALIKLLPLLKLLKSLIDFCCCCVLSFNDIICLLDNCSMKE